MKNFVMIYKLADQKASEEFLRKFIATYPKNTAEQVNGLTYYGFSTRKLQEVQDELYAILQNLPINQSDYVAIYYHRDGEEDAIKQYMVLGSSSLVDGDVNKLSDTIHEGTLNGLLSYEFINS